MAQDSQRSQEKTWEMRPANHSTSLVCRPFQRELSGSLVVCCGGGEGQGSVAAMNAWPRCHPRAGA